MIIWSPVSSLPDVPGKCVKAHELIAITDSITLHGNHESGTLMSGKYQVPVDQRINLH